ncbi:MAG: TonB-dependent receptor [Dysgonamonadaceae bacterium]|nr:TonB-dependent receptor [Dysgonamonadaceae bacterium]
MFAEIEKNSEYIFFYYDNVLDVTRKVNIRAKDETVDKILDKIFKDTENTYVIDDRQIFISKREAPETVLQQDNKVKVTGSVRDERGEPLIGASVVEKGTSNGIATNAEGSFTLSVDKNAILQVSYLGYVVQEIRVGNQTNFSITLQEDIAILEESVVIGYGTMKKKDLTGSVASLSDVSIADLLMSDVSKALQGRISGLDVVSAGSTPGAGSKIILRGRRSFEAANEPLYIVDGMAFYGDLNDINPYDIKSIDVLKDASSTAIYGSRGANGVIIISTKRGDVGKPRVTLESSAGIEVRYGNIPLLNTQQWVARFKEGLLMENPNRTEADLEEEVRRLLSETELENYQNGITTDWQDMVLQDGWHQKHQLSIQGGNDAVQYNIGFNTYNQEGLIPTFRFDRYSIRPNIDINLSKTLKIGISAALSYSIRHSKIYYFDGTGYEAISDSFDDACYLPPTSSPFDKNGNFLVRPGQSTTFYVNALMDQYNDSYRWENRRYSGFVNTFAEWQILPSLTYRFNAGFNANPNSDKVAAGQWSNWRRGSSSYARIINNETLSSNFENVLTYSKNFNDKHNLILTGIHSYQNYHMENSSIQVSELPYVPARWYNLGDATAGFVTSSNLQAWKLLSFAGRAFYSMNDRYLLTLSVRADGATQFAENHKWGYFPSVALGWRISEESFLKESSWLSNLKLRLSYGLTGNQAIAPYQTQGSLLTTVYDYNGAEGLGARPLELANKDLKWETTAVYNVGLDFGFFKGRINGNVELYKSITTDLLMYRNLPNTTGFSRVLENVGITQNKGIEIGLNTLNIQKHNFSWNTNFNFYLNREEIVELYNGKVDDPGSGWFIGYPIKVFYDYKKIGIWQLDEAEEAAKFGRKPGQIKVLDAKEDGILNSDDRVIVGSREPKFVCSLNNSFRYNNWDLAFNFYCRWGGTNETRSFIQQAFTNTNYMVVDYWTPTNPTNSYPRPDQSRTAHLESTTLAYRDASFIRMGTLSLGYTLPKNIVNNSLRLQNARIFFTGDNLWYWTKAEYRKNNLLVEWSGNDAEATAHADLFFPASRTYSLGVNITF